jgi:perosamine synthetase
MKNDSMSLNREEISDIIQAIKNENFTIFTDSCSKAFSNELKSAINKQELTLLPNCTTAISIALMLSKIEKGSVVLVPNLTHPSVIYAIISLGFNIAVYDFKVGSYDIDPESIIMPKNTRVMIICYLQGYPINITEVRRFCVKNKLILIEDVAQGLGVQMEGKNAGSFGNYSCFSFGSNKILRLGEGGAISHKTSEVNMIKKIIHVGEMWKSTQSTSVSNNISYENFIKHGMDYSGSAFNYRTLPYTFAYAYRRFKNIDKEIKERQKKLDLYSKLIKLKGVSLIENISYGIQQSAPLSAWLILDSKYDINKIILYLISKSIPVGHFKYDNINNIPYFKKYLRNSAECKNSKNIQQRSLLLPLFKGISQKDIKIIVKEFSFAINNCQNLPSTFPKENINYFDGLFFK